MSSMSLSIDKELALSKENDVVVDEAIDKFVEAENAYSTDSRWRKVELKDVKFVEIDVEKEIIL
jgi:hypothetical protein